jgi:hypothetical protein
VPERSFSVNDAVGISNNHLDAALGFGLPPLHRSGRLDRACAAELETKPRERLLARHHDLVRIRYDVSLAVRSTRLATGFYLEAP